MGRPSEYTEQTALLICDRLASGESLRKICADPDMPVISTVFLWLSKHSAFSNQYARARESWADATFEETLEIADNSRNDTQTDDEGRPIVNHDNIQRARLRVDTRKWALARMAPKRYGDKVETTLKGDPENPVQVVKTVWNLAPLKRSGV